MLQQLNRPATTPPRARGTRARLARTRPRPRELLLGKQLGYGTYDLSDCAEIKLSVIPETRDSLELDPSHRLLYREFEATDGGLPYREVVAFEPRKNDRPFEVAAARLGRRRGIRIQRLEAVVATRASAPIRQPLPSDLRQALATAIAGVPQSGPAAPRPPTAQRHTGPRRGAPPNREL